MLKNSQKYFVFFVYASVTAAIALWWTIAFRYEGIPESVLQPFNTPSALNSPSFLQLSRLDREKLILGLSGDIPTIERFLLDWSIDRELLLKNDFPLLETCSQEERLRALSLCRLLQSLSPDEATQLEQSEQWGHIQDDRGVVFDLKQSVYNSYIAQTLTSASFLLSLLPPSQIAAIPKIMRVQKEDFFKEVLKEVPEDADRFHSEGIFKLRPDLAIVASHSHPANLESFKRQSIKIFYLNSPLTLEGISAALIKVGHLCRHPLKAELMAIFMKAALDAIDYRLLFTKHTLKVSRAPKILYLIKFSQFCVPSQTTLTAQLLNRAGVGECTELLAPQMFEGWSVPIRLEQITHLNPDGIVVCGSETETLLQQLLAEKALWPLPCVAAGNCFPVDETTQSESSHFAVLAYFDICEAIKKTMVKMESYEKL